MMSSQLQQYIKETVDQFDQIPSDRKALLETLTAYIIDKRTSDPSSPVKLNFICTHNSRRSHFGQIWGQAAAYYYGIENVLTFSGGTEATAFNPRAVQAIKTAGFQVSLPEDQPNSQNPRYTIIYSEDMKPMIAFSKRFDDPYNPDAGYAAIMTCSHADQNCPLVLGMDKKFPITYEDPKAFDDTDKEAQMYNERCRQIARELFYVFSKVK